MTAPLTLPLGEGGDVRKSSIDFVGNATTFRPGPEDVKKAAEETPASTEFHYLSHGETYRFRVSSGGGA